MATQGNGLAAASFIDNFMRGYSFIDDMKSRQQARESAKADDAWKQEARGRQRSEWDYADSTRETPEEVKARRARGDELQGVQLEGAKFGLKKSQEDRQYEVDTRLPVEQVQEMQGLKLDDVRLGNKAKKQEMGQSAARERRAQAEFEQGQVRNRVLASLDFLDSPFAKQFDDPDFRQQATKFDDFFNNENATIGSSISAPQIYDFGNKLFSRELQKGVGDQLKDGSVIAAKRLVSARRKGDKVILELSITAQRPDGTTYEYQAPVTKNRSSDDADEVLELPISSVQDRIRGAHYLSKFVEQGGSLEQTKAELRRHALELGIDPAKLADRSKYGYQEIKRGDKIDTYETRNGRIAGEPISSAQRFNPNAGALGLGGVSLSTPEAGATAPAGGPRRVGRTPDGRVVYEDAQGNRFTEE